MNPLIPGKVEFVENHIPALEAGDYTLTVTQSISGSGIDQPSITAVQPFSVAGPRFRLNPSDIYALFPPPGSLGDHANVLPHIVLNRSTLPWERRANPQEQKTPWLALLLFHEDELKDEFVSAPYTAALTIADGRDGFVADSHKAGQSGPCKQTSGQTIALPNRLPPEAGQQPGAQVTLIDVRNDLLAALLPTQVDLYWLAHVRQRKDDNGAPVGDERVVILANRLPKPGGTSTAHLVSLEGWWGNDNPDPGSGNGDGCTTLISLKSWSFACVSPRYSFHQLLRHLNHEQKHLFSTDIRYLDALNQRPVSSALRDAFAQPGPQSPQGNPLTSAQPSLAHSEDTWVLTDGDKQYGFELVADNRFAVYPWRADKKPRMLTDKDPLFTIDAALLPEATGPVAVPPEIVSAFGKADPPISLSDSATIPHADIHWVVEDEGKRYYLKGEDNQLKVYRVGPNTLRLPYQENAALEWYYQRGYVPLPHTTRTAEKSISWYHGPFLPRAPQANARSLFAQDRAIRVSDQLLAYDSSVQMFDVAYAAAWKLGRLMGLQDVRFARELFLWKRESARFYAQQKRSAAHAHLPAGRQSTEPAALRQRREQVDAWLDKLNQLQGVPFNYLVPDEQMLPPESIRFFRVDPVWIEALLDGAFSVGRVTEADHKSDAWQRLARNRYAPMTGFLLRSQVVEGWPDLRIDAYAEILDDETAIHTTAARPALLRKEKLGNDLLLCLYQSEIKTVDIHLEPEALHFGFTSDDGDVTFYKELKEPDGTKMPESDGKANAVDVPFAQTQTLQAGNGPLEIERKVDMKPLADAIQDALSKADAADEQFTSAQFALQMIEGVDLVRFKAGA